METAKQNAAPTFAGCLISSGAAVVWTFWTVCRCFTAAVKLLFKVAKGKQSKRRMKGTLTSRNRWKEFARVADPAANLWVCFFAWRHIVRSAATMPSKPQQEPVAFQALLHRRALSSSSPTAGAVEFAFNVAIPTSTVAGRTAAFGPLKRTGHVQMLQNGYSRTAEQASGRKKSEGMTAERGTAPKS